MTHHRHPVGLHGRNLVMSISPVGSQAGDVPQVRPQSAPPARTTAPSGATVAGDSDGDNDGSKGGAVDVRA